MLIKKHNMERIVILLRTIELEIAHGKTTPQACKETQIAAHTYCRWLKELGGLKHDQAKRLREQEREYPKLDRQVAELSLDRQILKEEKESLCLLSPQTE